MTTSHERESQLIALMESTIHALSLAHANAFAPDAYHSDSTLDSNNATASLIATLTDLRYDHHVEIIERVLNHNYTTHDELWNDTHNSDDHWGNVVYEIISDLVVCEHSTPMTHDVLSRFTDI